MQTLNYLCKYGLYHDKPVLDGEPSSNNGWIYTAYAKKLGLPIDYNKLRETFSGCVMMRLGGKLKLTRLPYKYEPPISRDEILGMYYLDLISVKDLIKMEWSFSPYPLPKRNILKTIKALWGLKGKHRNTVWQKEGYEHAYWTAFRVPIHDQYWIMKREGLKMPLWLRVLGRIFEKHSLKSNNKTSLMINWLKHDVRGSQALLKYFGKEHIFYSAQFYEDK